MTDNKTNKVVVILSPGRADTSLLMKALGAMGMRFSEKMIPGSVGNPEGFFEDTEIVEVHKELLQDLSTHPVLPLPAGWLESEAAKKARPKLKKILENRLQESSAIWGFKDPRTASFLPLWNRILNAPGTVPVFILAVHDPAVVAVSLKRQINREEVITELQWLQRTTDALYHTAADCYIVHFEDWFTRPFELAQGLLEYTGLNQYFDGDLEVALKDIIKPNLNRAIYDDYKVQNEYVIKLYEVLKDCRGSSFAREKLMAVVKESRKAMNSFKGWYIEIHKYLQRQATLSESLIKRIDRSKRQIEKFEADMEKMVLKNNSLLKECKDYFEQVEHLRKMISQKQTLKARIVKLIIRNLKVIKNNA